MHLKILQRKNSDYVLLHWQTSSRQNINYFSVQRSNRGDEFDDIGVVNSNNTSLSQNYSFTDIHPKAGTNYYRIKQVSIDGKITYSSIAKIDVSDVLNIKIAPNPVQNILIITGLGISKDLFIANISGKIVLKVNSINDNYNWNIQQLPAGVYYLIAEEKGKNVASMKFIKQ